MKVLSFFKNRYVLYIATILGVVNLLGYIAMENYNSMALLVVMFLLARYFSKNIALNICIAIFVTSLVTLNNKISEGFRVKSDPPTSSQVKAAPIKSSGTISRRSRRLRDPVTAAARAPILDLRPNTQKGLIRRGTRQPIKVDPVLDPPDPVDPGGGGGEDPEEPDRPEEPEEPSKCPKGTEYIKGECVPMKLGFRNNVPSSKPAKINNSGDDDMDVAAKMEDAYGNLNKMLGDGAMASMANETKKLVAQQEELMNTLSTMTPALNKAKETLENLNLPNMEEMTGILKKFTQ